MIVFPIIFNSSKLNLEVFFIFIIRKKKETRCTNYFSERIFFKLKVVSLTGKLKQIITYHKLWHQEFLIFVKRKHLLDATEQSSRMHVV